MHTDRALTYDAWALELVAQQKWIVLNMEWSCDDPIEEEKGSPSADRKDNLIFCDDLRWVWITLAVVVIFEVISSQQSEIIQGSA